ncbi:glutathione peroxidase [Cryptosporidium ubiquitum]|uniref:Glutathione peroxidase n=1 Tax=Cryptosporidium ubiquitum TaxID=857276 RepID=A0A1J4MJ49_9CRYT|nr:glutathione peroxidase [Cryptosporidium ubiquitum]OII72885.1 glutathione peroxidase [Cryptosporidium ubiquitum]
MGNFLASTKITNDLSSKSVYSYTLRTLEGNPFPMENLKGKVVMVTNVASKCGYTKSYYKQMVRIYSVFAPLGLEIIGLPTREFMGQEFASPQEIRKFADSQNVKFPLMEICKVNGPDSLEFVQKLKRETPELYNEKSNTLSPIKWNFSRFLIDQNGKVVAFRGTRTEPTELIPKIAELLGVPNYEELLQKYDQLTPDSGQDSQDDVCPLKHK